MLNARSNVLIPVPDLIGVGSRLRIHAEASEAGHGHFFSTAENKLGGIEDVLLEICQCDGGGHYVELHEFAGFAQLIF